MKEAVFIINNRFTAHSLRNEVIDKETGQKPRLEPRLMKLLCKLAEQQGEVVKREFINREIWADYPGANEGLNQAISFLRKLLSDEDKKIIQTQPKAGYIFHAIISWGRENGAAKKRNYLPAIIFASVLLLVLIFVIARYYPKKDIPANPAKELYEKDAGQAAKRDSVQQLEGTRGSKDTSGSAAMKLKGRIDAKTAEKDSIRQSERGR